MVQESTTWHHSGCSAACAVSFAARPSSSGTVVCFLLQRLPSQMFVARLNLQASRLASMTPTWRSALCCTVLPALFDLREPASESRHILKRVARRTRCRARTSLCGTYKCSRTGLAPWQAGGAALDNARERRFGNGREPRVLWKIHAAFIAILLQTGGGSEWKDRDSTGDVTMSCHSCGCRHSKYVQ